MPQRFLVWGNNCAGALDPSSTDLLIHRPKDVTAVVECDEILWHSWACTIGRSFQSAEGSKAWGIGAPSIDDRGAMSIFRQPGKMLGFGQALAQLGRDGTVRTMSGEPSWGPWDDLGITEVGPCIGWRVGAGLQTFASIEHLKQSDGQQLTHPLLPLSGSVTLIATEARLFVLVHSGLHSLLEVVTDRGGRPCDPHIDPIAGLEGMGIISVIAGSANRLGIVTDTGQAFVLPARSQELELVDVEDDVRLLGLGSKHEVLVGEKAVWVRGDNNFGQLGNGGAVCEDYVELDTIDPSEVVAIHCGRWSTILSLRSTP